MYKVYLLLGSNLGDRENIINEAVMELIDALLPSYSEVGSLSDAVNTSKIYETEPWGFESKDKFMNQAFTCVTELTPEEVLKECLRIEKELGRVREGAQFDSKGNRIYSSRYIDIDILLMYKLEKDKTGEEWVLCEVDTQDLTIPHPRLKDREFAKKPMRDLQNGAPKNFANFVKK